MASPDNASDPFGYQIGNNYTLRWGAPGDSTDCGTDETKPIIIGQSVEMDNGAKETEMSAIALRVEIDRDGSSATYPDYLAHGTGNGARVVVLPINSGGPNYIAIGFAGFFLLNDDYYSNLKGGNNSACAEYIGAWTQGASATPPGGSGAYRLRLFR